MHPYQKLLVWQRAHRLAVTVHGHSNGWTDSVLRTQVRRAALSVPSNIVEGAASPSQAMFARYLGTALASAAELEYQLLFASEITLLTAGEHALLHAELLELKRMLIALLKRTREHGRNERPGARAREEARGTGAGSGPRRGVPSASTETSLPDPADEGKM
jgi:four helix bundle protein